MELRQFPQNPKALLIEAKDKIIALEAQLAEANEKLDKYAGMCLSCPDMGMTLVVERLEQEQAELLRENAELKERLRPAARKPYGQGDVWTAPDAGVVVEWSKEAE